MEVLVIGATGLVGKEMVLQLLETAEVVRVSAFVRRKTGVVHSKFSEEIVDFDNIQSWSHLLKGDVLFSALGTTLKTVGSKEAQYKIDHDYQLQVAEAAAKNNVKAYVLISSVNANKKASIFYLKMKGELEDKIQRLPFSSITILRPGPLKGVREKSRLGEVISTGILERLPRLLIPKSFIPVLGSTVAKRSIFYGLRGEKGMKIVEAGDCL
jgi:uncharacterized protein YbjT (DUF2867 family)